MFSRLEEVVEEGMVLLEFQRFSMMQVVGCSPRRVYAPQGFLPYSPFHKARDGAGLTRRDEEMDML